MVNKQSEKECLWQASYKPSTEDSEDPNEPEAIANNLVDISDPKALLH